MMKQYQPVFYWAAAYVVGNAIHVGPYRYFRWRAELDAMWFRWRQKELVSVGRFS